MPVWVKKKITRNRDLNENIENISFTDNLISMKVINGQRRGLEKDIVRLLMSDADESFIDKVLDKLKPAGQLKLVATDLHLKSQPAPESRHQPVEDKI